MIVSLNIMSPSSIHLCQGPLPMALPQYRSNVVISLSPLHMNYCRLHRFSNEMNNGNNNIVRGERGGSLMACSVLGAFSLSGKMKEKGSISACAGGQCSDAAEEGSVTGPLKKLMTSSFFESEPDDNEIEALKVYNSLPYYCLNYFRSKFGEEFLIKSY